MNIKYLKLFNFSIAQFINPVKIPYWQTYGSESIAIPEHQQILHELFQTSIQLLIQSQENNEKIHKQYLKELQQTKEIKHNIKYNLDIEWGLLERLFGLRNELDNYRQQLVFQSIDNLNTLKWIKLGELEVYGLSPYRHQNHYIHHYKHNQENEIITFKVKEINQSNIKLESQIGDITKPLLDKLEQEKKEKQSAFQATKDFIRKFNKKVIPNNEIVDMKSTINNIKTKVIQPSKQNRILVRDYELDFNGILTIKREQNNEYFDGQNWVQQEQIQPKNIKILLRTEAWIEEKESTITLKSKRQVLTDINFIMFGNPWCWVKRFDLEENEQQNQSN